MISLNSAKAIQFSSQKNTAILHF